MKFLLSPARMGSKASVMRIHLRPAKADLNLDPGPLRHPGEVVRCSVGIWSNLGIDVR